jgi:hypothetical protein
MKVVRTLSRKANNTMSHKNGPDRAGLPATLDIRDSMNSILEQARVHLHIGRAATGCSAGDLSASKPVAAPGAFSMLRITADRPFARCRNRRAKRGPELHVGRIGHPDGRLRGSPVFNVFDRAQPARLRMSYRAVAVEVASGVQVRLAASSTWLAEAGGVRRGIQQHLVLQINRAADDLGSLGMLSERWHSVVN